METTCVHYSRDYVGNPCIVALDRDRCAVADGTGHLSLDRPAVAGGPVAGLRGRHGRRSGLQPPLVATPSVAAGHRGGRHPGAPMR